MPLKLFKRYQKDGSFVWHYRGAVADDYIRGSTGTANKKDAARVAAAVEHKHLNRHLDGPQAALTFPEAVAHYLKAGKPDKYLGKIEDYWKDTKVKDMTAGAIRQSAIDIYPKAGGATRNRQVITPTQAIINHCAELELCPPIRIKRFKFDAKIKKPVSLDWVTALAANSRPVIKALVLTMFSTACRFSEARRLEWADIDFHGRTIKIQDTKTGNERFAHMTQPLLVALANLPRDRKPFFWSETQLRRLWDEDVKAVGFERLTFHSCRHGFATKMLRDKVDPKTAASLGGWADIGLFMKTYAHAMEDATLTEGLFGTYTARGEDQVEEKQEVKKK